LDNNINAKIIFEISQIDKLISEAESLLKLCKLKEPDFIELSAAAMVLHSFYNGIENILILIIKNIENKLPNNNKWHMELLEKAFEPLENGKQILRNDLQETMEEYLKFRHFVRHAYSYKLKWEQMEYLINNIENIWKKLKKI
jgi:hypothetical protein